MHYLDDFLIIWDPGSKECEQSLKRALEMGGPYLQHIRMERLRVIIFLGIKLNMTVWLPGRS